jgi:fatty-acyl-CoA synthase
MAIVVCEDGAGELSLARIQSFCDGRLAPFKIPTRIAILDALPRGVLGKIDKVTLRARFAAHDPELNGGTNHDASTRD